MFGLGISPVGLITPANFKGITYIDPVIAARDVVKKLREEERCALVVACRISVITKTDERGDSLVAAQVDGIDFIASGHTHTFMEEPVTQTQPCGAKTLIFQVGKSGIYVGRVDFTFRAGKFDCGLSAVAWISIGTSFRSGTLELRLNPRSSSLRSVRALVRRCWRKPRLKVSPKSR